MCLIALGRQKRRLINHCPPISEEVPRTPPGHMLINIYFTAGHQRIKVIHIDPLCKAEIEVS